MDAPIKYNDPAYDLIDQRAEARVGLKPGVLSAIRLHGERSNANQVSSAGARSVYQITPTTRNLILKKYGVDPYLSAQNAALGSALILKEAHDRNGGDTLKAVREYIGGTNPKNWGKTTASYVSRVAKALNPINTANAAELPSQDLIDEFHAWQAKQQQAAQPQQEQQAAQPQQEQQAEQPEQAQPDQALIDEFHAWQEKQQQSAAIQEQAPQQTPSPLSINPYKAEAMGAGVLNNALSPTDNQEQQYAEGDRLGQRMARDITGIGQGVIDTVKHPVQTVENAAGLVRGGMQSALPESVTNALVKTGITPEARPQFNQFTQGLKESYGSPEAIMKTAHDRPVSTALNLAGLVTGGAGLLRNAPAEVAAAAPVIDAWTQAPRVGSRIAQATARNASSAGAQFAQRALAEGASPEIAQTIGQAEQLGILNETAAGRHIEASTLPVPVPLREGQATGDVRQLSMEKNLRGKYVELSDHDVLQNKKLAENLPAIQEQASPDIYGGSHIDDGQLLIDAYKKNDAALNADIREKYKALEDANGGSFPLDSNYFIDRVRGEFSRNFKGNFLPPKINKIMVEMKKRGSMTFEEFENLRTTLATEARKYDGGLKADGNKYAAVMGVRRALEDTPVLPGATTELKQLADTARAAAANRFKILENDPAYEAAVNDKVSPDDFTKKFIISGKRNHLENMAQNLVNNPLAPQLINNSVVRYLTSKAKIIDGEGNFAAGSYNNALNALEPKLTGIMDTTTLGSLRKLGNVAKYVQEQPAGSFINNSNTHVARIAEYGSELAHKIPGIGTAMDVHTKNIELQRIRDALKPGAGLINKTTGN